MPMLDIGQDLHDIAHRKVPGGLAPLLVQAAALRHEEDLPARMAMPAVPRSRPEGDVADRAIEYRFFDEHFEPGPSLEVGARKYLAPGKDIDEDFLILHMPLLAAPPCDGPALVSDSALYDTDGKPGSRIRFLFVYCLIVQKPGGPGFHVPSPDAILPGRERKG